MQLKDSIKDFPQESGVYIIRSQGKVIYVGKSASLRDRIHSYFSPNKSTSLKTKLLREDADDIDYIVTESEVEALILEENLIKEYRPRFNVLLKDNKRYPYLKITDEDYPKVVVTRNRESDSSEVFGPYANAGAMRRTLDTLRQIFSIKDCSWTNDDGPRRPCLRYHIGRCSAPCAGKITKEKYMESVDQIREILKGRYQRVIDLLEDKMGSASSDHDYEKAAEWRDKIQAVKKIANRQRVRLNDELDRDFLALDTRDGSGIVQIFFVRRGRISGQDSFELEFPSGERKNSIIGEFIKKFYASRDIIPEEIYVQMEPRDKSTIEDWLEKIRSEKVNIIVPKRGVKKEILEMAKRNAKFNFRPTGTRSNDSTVGGLLALQESLNLATPPKRIEGYDISNTSGTDAVGSMVVFLNGKPSPSDYRRFKISELTAPDDYEMLKQVLRRRFIHGRKDMDADKKNEEIDQSFATFPNLILIDGGKGQLNSAVEVLGKLNMDNIPAISLAKEYEQVFEPYRGAPVGFDRGSDGLKLLQRVRDEAHRFALDYHRRLRQKRTVRSSLDSIKGVGPKRKAQLLNTFNSVEGIRKASLEELKSLPRIPEKVAKRIFDFFSNSYS